MLLLAEARPDCQVQFHGWLIEPEIWSLAGQIDEVSHASWVENFPAVRVDGVDVPKGRKPLVDLAALEGADPVGVRELLGDGPGGGPYQRPEKDTDRVWKAAVALLRGPSGSPVAGRMASSRQTALAHGISCSSACASASDPSQAPQARDRVDWTVQLVPEVRIRFAPRLRPHSRAAVCAMTESPVAGVLTADGGTAARLDYQLADEPRVLARITWGGRWIDYPALLDSGASTTLLPRHAAETLQIPLAEFAVRQGAGHLGVVTAQIQRAAPSATCHLITADGQTWGVPIEIAPHFQIEDPAGDPSWSAALGRCDFFAAFSAVTFHAHADGTGQVVLDGQQANPLALRPPDQGRSHAGQ